MRTSTRTGASSPSSRMRAPSASRRSRRSTRTRWDLRLAFLEYTRTLGGRHLQVPRRTPGLRLRPAAIRLLTRRAQRAPVLRCGLGRLGDGHLALHRVRQPAGASMPTSSLSTTRPTATSASTPCASNAMSSATTSCPAYYSFYQRDNVKYVFASGNEQRNIFDLRFAGTAGRLSTGISRRWARPAASG